MTAAVSVTDPRTEPKIPLGEQRIPMEEPRAKASVRALIGVERRNRIDRDTTRRAVRRRDEDVRRAAAKDESNRSGESC